MESPVLLYILISETMANEYFPWNAGWHVKNMTCYKNKTKDRIQNNVVKWKNVG